MDLDQGAGQKFFQLKESNSELFYEPKSKENEASATVKLFRGRACPQAVYSSNKASQFLNLTCSNLIEHLEPKQLVDHLE